MNNFLWLTIASMFTLSLTPSCVSPGATYTKFGKISRSKSQSLCIENNPVVSLNPDALCPESENITLPSITVDCSKTLVHIRSLWNEGDSKTRDIVGKTLSLPDIENCILKKSPDQILSLLGDPDSIKSSSGLEWNYIIDPSSKKSDSRNYLNLVFNDENQVSTVTYYEFDIVKPRSFHSCFRHAPLKSVSHNT